MDAAVYTSETCVLTLNYAYYHIFFCLLQALVLGCSGRTENFRTAHAFGLFALLMDYGVNFMNTETRTIRYPYIAENLDGGVGVGDEPLGPLGDFLFFFWFDYAAFGLILWALTMEIHIRSAILNGFRRTLRTLSGQYIELFSIIIVPLQFWTAPSLAPMLVIDNRTLILSRESSKVGYIVMVIVFSLLLKFTIQMEWVLGILPIAMAGFGCGLCHHAALFTFGMRAYSDVYSLLITLVTEWPALILGLAVVIRLGQSVVAKFVPFISGLISNQSYPVVCFTCTIWAGLGLALFPHLASVTDKDAMAYLIPMIPGQHMQTVGTAFFRARTCVAPRYDMVSADHSRFILCLKH